MFEDAGGGARQFGWNPAGPVAQAYGEARDPIALIVGPTAGGKTTETIRRTIRVAQWQHPSPIDGVRKARTIVLVPTYRRLWQQFIPSYKEEIKWWERGWKGGFGEPAQHIYDFLWKDRNGRVIGPVHVEVLFMAPGEASGGDLEDFFRGTPTTCFAFPEMDTHETQDMLSLASNRTGRYPFPDDRPHPDLGLPKAYDGVFGDANAPLIGGWMHKRFFIEHRPSDRLFLQPPGYDPNSPDGFHPLAENVEALRRMDRNYYKTKAVTHEPWDVARLLQNQPGYSRHGQPVHPDFDTMRMVAKGGLKADPEQPLVIGLDAGSNTLNHGAVFCQRTWVGQVRCMAEFAPEGQTDIVQASEAIRRIVETRFRDVKRIVIEGDPAMRGQSAMKVGVTWAQIVQQMTGIETRPAQSNDPRVRRTAVDQMLRKACGANEPGFVVSAPDCPRLIAALAGEYRFKRNADGKVQPTPEKNQASHVADALQYAVLGLNGVGAVEGRFIHSGDDEAQSGDLAALLPG